MVAVPAVVAPRRPWRLPLIAALALAFASLALISGVAYIAVLTGATTRAEFHAHSIAHILEDVASLPFVLRQD